MNIFRTAAHLGSYFSKPTVRCFGHYNNDLASFVLLSKKIRDVSVALRETKMALKPLRMRQASINRELNEMKVALKPLRMHQASLNRELTYLKDQVKVLRSFSRHNSPPPPESPPSPTN